MKRNTEATLSEYQGLSNELLKNLLSQNPLYPAIWWQRCFKRFLRQENPWEIKSWLTWRKLNYGGLNSKKLKYEYKKRGGNHDFVLYVLNALETSSGQRSVDLLVAPVKMIGFDKPATITEIGKKLLEEGFGLLTPEMAIFLSFEIDFADPFNIVTDLIFTNDGQKFGLAMSGGNLFSVHGDFKLPLNYDIVFVKKKIAREQNSNRI